MNEITPEMLQAAQNDPALMQLLQKQMAEAAMLGREQETAEKAINRNRHGYGTNTGQTFVGNPLGAAIGGFQAGRAMRQLPDIMRRGKEAAGTYGRAVAGMGQPGAATEMPMTMEQARMEALRKRDLGY